MYLFDKKSIAYIENKTPFYLKLEYTHEVYSYILYVFFLFINNVQKLIFWRTEG